MSNNFIQIFKLSQVLNRDVWEDIIWFIIILDINFSVLQNNTLWRRERRERTPVYSVQILQFEGKHSQFCISLYVFHLSVEPLPHILFFNILLKCSVTDSFYCTFTFCPLPLNICVKWTTRTVHGASQPHSQISPAKGGFSSSHHKLFSPSWNI